METVLLPPLNGQVCICVTLYLFRRQCLSIKYIAIKKVYLVTHCHYETKSTITENTFDILAGTLLVAGNPC